MDDDKSLFSEIGRSCMLFSVRKAARAITDVYEAILAPSGISAPQYTLLVAIKNYEPVSMSKLALGLHTDRTTLTRTLKPLQEKGWIEIVPGKDRRVQEVRLTVSGNAMLEGAVPLWRQAQKQVQEQLGDEVWDSLLTHLHSVANLKH